MYFVFLDCLLTVLFSLSPPPSLLLVSLIYNLLHNFNPGASTPSCQMFLSFCQVEAVDTDPSNCFVNITKFIYVGHLNNLS